MNYDYHFIIKELAKEFEEIFNCLAENTEKCKTFLVPVTGEVKRIDKNGKETTKTIFYKLQFIESTRFMAISLSNLADNLTERTHKVKCIYVYNKKTVKRLELNTDFVSVVLNTQTLKLI